jgi:hypothetical protein
MDFKKLIFHSLIAIPIVGLDILVVNAWKFVYEHNICYINDCDCEYVNMSIQNCTNCRVVEAFCFGVSPTPMIICTIFAFGFSVYWIYSFVRNV